MTSEYNIFIGENIKLPNGKTHRVAEFAILDSLDRRLGEYFTGWTVTKGRGFWGGMEEPSTIVTVIDDAEDGIGGTLVRSPKKLGEETAQHCEITILNGFDGTFQKSRL